MTGSKQDTEAAGSILMNRAVGERSGSDTSRTVRSGVGVQK